MKRKFLEIRKRMLANLEKTEMTRMQLAKSLRADYRTIDRHLIWLIGQEKIRKIPKDDKIFYTAIR